MDWCWWDHCYWDYDPRPIICRPRVYDPCPIWRVAPLPVWQPLPQIVCGTWVDPPVIVVPPRSFDLQMLAVRFVDPGHPEQKLGPRYRVWFRNVSGTNLDAEFNVMVLAGNDPSLGGEYVEAGVRVTGMLAGETQTVDIRLPFEATTIHRDDQGREIPFSHLHVVIDSHNEIDEEFPANNGVTLARGDVLPVDPALFSTDSETLTPGSEVLLAGEGLGPEPGKVLVFVNGLELQPEIIGWFDLGVRFKLPALPVANPTDMDIVVVRGDGAATNSLPVKLVPADALPPPVPR